MLTEKILQGGSNAVSILLGIKYSPQKDLFDDQRLRKFLKEAQDPEKIKIEDPEKIKELFTKAKDGLVKVAEEFKKVEESGGKIDPRKLREMMDKIKQIGEKFGISLELDHTEEGDPFVRVFNRSNHQQLTTIPLQLFLRAMAEEQARMERKIEQRGDQVERTQTQGEVGSRQEIQVPAMGTEYHAQEDESQGTVGSGGSIADILA